MSHTKQQIAVMAEVNHAALAPLEAEVKREEDAMALFPSLFDTETERMDDMRLRDNDPLDGVKCKAQGCQTTALWPHTYCSHCEGL